MSNQGKAKLTRREMLRASLTAGGVALVGFHDFSLPDFFGSAREDAFKGGKYLGLIEFVGEGLIPMETPMGAGLDGRLYTCLLYTSRCV